MAMHNTMHCDFNLKKKRKKEGIFENSEKYGWRKKAYREETVERNLKMSESLFIIINII